MTPLSDLVTEALVHALRDAIGRGEFPGITFQQAMEFLLSDGIVPASDLPVGSILALEDWARCWGTERGAASGLAFP
jgi:hypothetical protein